MSGRSGASYLICATPRTGSTFLCSLLRSTGIAGQPESYFRREDETRWAAQWGILREDESFAFSEYLEGTINAGRSENGVFGARIMWGTMTELSGNLAGLYPGVAGSGIKLLQAAFGDVQFLYLKRTDVVAQAISRLRAEQTDLWHVTDDTTTTATAQDAHYDFERIGVFVREADEHNAAWEAWFREQGIDPHRVFYEDLADSPATEIRRIMTYLRLDPETAGWLESGNKRMADEISHEWAMRYRKEAGV